MKMKIRPNLFVATVALALVALGAEGCVGGTIHFGFPVPPPMAHRSQYGGHQPPVRVIIVPARQHYDCRWERGYYPSPPPYRQHPWR